MDCANDLFLPFGGQSGKTSKWHGKRLAKDEENWKRGDELVSGD